MAAEKNGHGDETTFGLKNLRVGLDDLRWIFFLAIAGIAWGLKLEFRIDGAEAGLSARLDQALGEQSRLEARVQYLERQVGAGILPRAEERIEYLEENQSTLYQMVRGLEAREHQ